MNSGCYIKVDLSRHKRKITTFLTPFFLLLILTFYCSTPALAGTIEAAQSGNWSSKTTWVGGMVPGEVDDVQILVDAAVTITIDVDVKIASLQLGAGGTLAKKDILILDFDKNLIITGDFKWNKVGEFQQKAGSNVTAANYFIGTIGAGYSLMAWRIYGVAGNKASVHGSGNIVGAVPSSSPVQQIDWNYADFNIFGYIQIGLKNAWDSFAFSNLKIDHCYFNQTGFIDLGQYANSANDMIITNNDFRNITSTISDAHILIRTPVLGTLGNFAFNGNIISQSSASLGGVTIYSLGNNREIFNNVFRNMSLNVYYSTAITLPAQKSFKVHHNIFNTSPDLPYGGAGGFLRDYAGGLEIYDNLFSGESGNLHVVIMPAVPGSPKSVIRNNVFDIDDPDADIIIPNYIDVDIVENIFIGKGTPINLGVSGGGGIGSLSPNSGVVLAKNNTSYLYSASIYSPWAGLVWAGETSQHTGGAVTFINNLIGDSNNTTAMGYRDTQGTLDLFDYIDYNWFYNGNGGNFDPYYEGWNAAYATTEKINMTAKTEGETEGFGKYDQMGDPQFYDESRNLISMDLSLGGPGTKSHVTAEMMKKNQNVPGEKWNDSYDLVRVLNYIRLGFVPLNSNLANSGQSGSFLGAAEKADYLFNTWTGAIDRDWNTQGNWSRNEVPTAADQVHIPNLSNDPIIDASRDTPANCHDLYIESGATLTIVAGKALTVAGTLINETGDSGILIQSNSNGAGSLLHSTSNVSGTSQLSIPGQDNKWHMISSPVVNQLIAAPFVTDAHLFTWNEPAQCWVKFGLEVGYPTWAQANWNNLLNQGKGYLVLYDEEDPSKQFSGIFNQGLTTSPLQFEAKSKDNYQGYNMVGNTYPSSIDWNAQSGWGRADLVEESGGGNTYWVWNGTAGNYGAFISGGVEGSGTNGATRYIAPNQAYWVRARNAGSITMDNRIRLHASEAVLKSKTFGDDILRLAVSGGINTYSDEVVIKFSNSERIGGAKKMFSLYNSSPSLYTVSNKEFYSINHIPESSIQPIPLCFIPGTSGVYVLEYMGNMANRIIILEDMITGIKINMTNKRSYKFEAGQTDNPNRFFLHINEISTESEVNSAKKNELNFNFKRNGCLQIFGPIGKDTNAYLYDIQGRLLSNHLLEYGTYNIIEVLNLKDGLYIIAIKGLDNYQSFKLLIKN